MSFSLGSLLSSATSCTFCSPGNLNRSTLPGLTQVQLRLPVGSGSWNWGLQSHHGRSFSLVPALLSCLLTGLTFGILHLTAPIGYSHQALSASATSVFTCPLCPGLLPTALHWRCLLSSDIYTFT